MTRNVRLALALLVAGCSGQPGQDARTPPTPPADAAPAPPVEAAPAPRATAGPLLTPEVAVDLGPRPVPAGQRVPRYSYPESYSLPPPATPIPVLPARKPARVLGDLRFIAPGSGAGGVALSPDGKRLAVGTCLFDATTGQLDAAYDPAGNPVHKLAFSPDGTRLYSGEGHRTSGSPSDGTLAIRDVPGKRQLLTIAASDWGLSGDGGLLVTLQRIDYDPHAGQPGLRPAFRYLYPGVRVYDTKTWKGVAAYRVHGPQPTAVALSPDGGRILIGCDDGAVRVWDRAAGREVAVLRDLCEAPFPTHKPVAYLFAFSPDGRTLAAANARRHDGKNPQQVAWWQWPEGRLIHVKPVGIYHDPTDLRFSPDGKYLFAGRRNGATVWDATTGEVRTELDRDRNNRAVPAVSFAAAGRVFAAGGARPALLGFPSLDPVPWPDRPFDDQPKVPFELAGPVPPADAREKRNGQIRLPDGSRLQSYSVSRSPDWGVQLVGPDGEPVRHFEKGRVVVFDVTPDGKLLAASGHNAAGQGVDRPLRFWDVATGKEVAAIRVYPWPDYAMRFSPDGRRLAVRHADGLVRIWDVAARKPLLALDPDGFWPARLTFSKDGRSLVGGEAGSPVLLVWNVADDGG